MRRFTITEHEQIWRVDDDVEPGDECGGRRCVSADTFERLHFFDEQQAPDADSLLFDWRRRSFKASSTVGVFQIPGLTVEILPKIERPNAGGNGREKEQESARASLLKMLAIAGELPITERDVALHASRSAPISETLLRLFAERLREELRKGRSRRYIEFERNRTYLRGKLEFTGHLRYNIHRKDRFYVSQDEFSADTWLNRIFRAACELLVGVAQAPKTVDLIRHCLVMLDDVERVDIRPTDFDRVILDRQNERFRDVYNFCRLILSGESPIPRAGERSTFSLLFNMNAVFEAFLTEGVRRYVMPHLEQHRLHAQGKGDYLLRCVERTKKRRVQLKPDLLIEHKHDRNSTAVLDAKWKRLNVSSDGTVYGITSTDFYQLCSYADRYAAKVSLLMYPEVSPHAETLSYARSHEFEGPPMQLRDPDATRIGFDFVRLTELVSGDDVAQAFAPLRERLKAALVGGVKGRNARPS